MLICIKPTSQSSVILLQSAESTYGGVSVRKERKVQLADQVESIVYMDVYDYWNILQL